ncbi:hypothetical protein IFM89_023280 [Coptis chinensis]|uniref:Atg6 BARA domain-containing protein n=1 Tax=Coptis chinensis TaxID=261450 RepID=A0A835H8C7_9MAGN|nr:hypothetical protein IFM89_023280 [Coptis chinensis]
MYLFEFLAKSVLLLHYLFRLEKRSEDLKKQSKKLRQCAEVNTELKELDLKSKSFGELEERYWHEFNSFQFQLTSHQLPYPHANDEYNSLSDSQEERDVILAKITVSQLHLELLKRTNVLNDAFPIYHDGEFGTINNFRLGRLPKILVEWDEINAAWGQACLLLHTMAQYFRPKFPYPYK